MITIHEFITTEKCRDCGTIQIFQAEKVKLGWKGNFHCETCRTTGRHNYLYSDKKIQELGWKVLDF